MERTTVSIEWKANDDGTLEGYASTFGNVDLGRDVVEKGAFTKSIEDIRSSGIPLLADHVASTSSVLGTIFDAREDRKGLRIKARFSSAASAQDVRTKLVEGHLSKLSIGYEPTKYAFAERSGKQVRLLQEIKLWETSVVVFPMNPEATIERVKSLAGDLTTAQRKELASAIVTTDEKATANDVRDQLNTLVREAYGSDTADVWVRDFDESTVWFDVWDGQDSGTYQQSYATDDDGSMSLDGDRSKVRAVTTYVPDDKSAPEDSDAKVGVGEAEARHAEAEESKDGAPAGTPGETSWDRYASDAVLAGNDPTALADQAKRAALKTALELGEQRNQELAAVAPDRRARLAASLKAAEALV